MIRLAHCKAWLCNGHKFHLWSVLYLSGMHCHKGNSLLIMLDRLPVWRIGFCSTVCSYPLPIYSLHFQYTCMLACFMNLAHMEDKIKELITNTVSEEFNGLMFKTLSCHLKQWCYDHTNKFCGQKMAQPKLLHRILQNIFNCFIGM